MKKIKYEHKEGRELVRVGDEVVEFFDSSDAWKFLELMRRCFGAGRSRVGGCFPVDRLVPRTPPKKKKVYFIGASERVGEVVS